MLPKKMLCCVDLLYRLCDRFFFRHKETKQQIVDFYLCKNARRNRQRIACHYDSCSSGPYKDEIWFEEDSNSGIISGNVTRAVNKVLKMIEKVETLFYSLFS